MPVERLHAYRAVCDECGAATAVYHQARWLPLPDGWSVTHERDNPRNVATRETVRCPGCQSPTWTGSAVSSSVSRRPD